MPPRRRRRLTRMVTEGQAHIHATFNNPIVTITDDTGAVLTWASGGTSGFKGSRKGTPYAAQITSDGAARQALELGMRRIAVFVKGPGSGRDAAIRALQAAGLQIMSISDVTPIPHNGPRPRKRPRN